MIEDLLFFCPNCLQQDAVITRGKTRCSHCGAVVKRRGRTIIINGKARPVHVWFEKIKRLPLDPPAESEVMNSDVEAKEKILLVSGDAILSQAQPRGSWRAHPAISAQLELTGHKVTGHFVLTDRKFCFNNEVASYVFPLEKITCITTDSRHFVLKVRGEPYFHIDFDSESPLKYEVAARRILDEFWMREHRKTILEYQPRITFKEDEKDFVSRKLILTPTAVTREPFYEKLSYWLLKTTAAFIFKFVLQVRVVGKEHIPQQGPFIMILNHEGYLDAFFAQALLPRRISFLAKNTEFKNPLFRYVLKVFRAIPVRRYEIDPSCVRNTLKMLALGHPVGIFVEGERTWDGLFLPPKRGTVKLLLRAGVPIVPVRIEGSFDMLPRWDKRLQWFRVRLLIGQPFNPGQKIRDLDTASKKIMEALAKL